MLGMAQNHALCVTLVSTKIQQDLMNVLLVVLEKLQLHQDLQMYQTVSFYSGL